LPSATPEIDPVSEPRDGAHDERCASDQQLEEVYRAQAPGLARYFRARFRGQEDPDDMVQDLFARLAAGRPLRELRNPQAYFKRILRNYLIDRNRRLRRAPLMLPLDGVQPAVPPDQSHAIEVKQLQDRYRAGVDALPPRTREVFLMHRVEETSVKAIADQLGISSRTVEWHLAQAIMKIGEVLERE
jgi:RNA polymerase sigma-70 factor (ECF subfamily)